ncbi:MULTISPECIES: grasp-with-spasm system ATP-grasp peptide maturase [unclassified Chryseobacterium]|uniref:grasp-with-spasm system ATP-grasp peptide maturase n=1 Tax=unclassified Chryseobacterium TaxID=2593645 RepID=UPI001AE4A9C2|nr:MULTISPECIES: grasp-with-spasm system ATP-grasp peptide maturase [unclassified Chryseobacterium]MBP1165616.1 ATP-GRASP peptide maturase of grasp-with-spasm system [Chryseobacterium sp. PvR013]MDR4894450.1 grasp-with-spasm system ATP-grasp peptide maturase [Chryseobacterium sp. CFS7]
MILIISDNNDISTTEVIKWLLVMEKKFIRVHEDEIFEIKIRNKSFFLESARSLFFLDDIHSVWYRRGGLNFKRLRYKNKAININMNETQHWLEDYVKKKLESVKHINKESNSLVNKLLVLEEAEKVGLDVPPYFISENTDDVILGKTIVKTIAGNPMLEFFYKNSNGMMFTSVVEEYEKENFFPTFFQEKIEKDFEVRTFYLNGKCWSIGIFSQNDEQTKVDFRNYNYKKRNRNIRYNLPLEIEEKVHQLMELLDLNCGSLDFMKSGDKFYFLEVNPIGQFGYLSNICNYSLEKEIAEYL